MDQYAELSDEALFAVCVKDIQAFELLVRRYEKKLTGYIRKRSHASSEDIQDILQNVFLKVYKNMYDFDTSLSFSSWVYRICHNEMIDWYRREKVRATLSLDDDEGLLEKVTEEKGIYDHIKHEEQKEILQKVLSELPSLYQDIFSLRYFEEKGYEEIADILTIPPGTVATYISRGKKKLQEKLQTYGYTR